MDDPIIRNGVHCDGLLREAEEEFAAAAGSSPVEPERELVEVVVEMFVADRPLVGSHQPALEEGNHAMDPGHQLRRGLLLPL